MKRVIVALILGSIILSCSNHSNKAAVKALLIEQLENTHTKQDWFVPAKTAMEGLSYEQASLKDSTDNHSIIEIVSHLIFWNERILKAFKEEEVSDFDNNNEVTFEDYKELDWTNSVMKLDSIQAEWQQAVKDATYNQIEVWSSEISNMAAHTAYHTGQIIYIRKQHGWWK
ncbi:MAG: DinB family protein [Bacteroidota bacterium]